LIGSRAAVAKGDNRRGPEGLADVDLKKAFGQRNKLDNGLSKQGTDPQQAQVSQGGSLRSQERPRWLVLGPPQEAAPSPTEPAIEVPRSQQHRKAQRSTVDTSAENVPCTSAGERSTSQKVEDRGNAYSAQPKKRLPKRVAVDTVDTQMVPHGVHEATADAASAVADAAPPTEADSKLRLPVMRRRQKQPDPCDKRQCSVRTAESQRTTDKRRKRAQLEENKTAAHEQRQKCCARSSCQKWILHGVLGCIGALVTVAVMVGAASFSTPAKSPKMTENVENQRSRAFVFRSAHSWSTIHPHKKLSSGKKKIEGRLQKLEFEIEYALASARGQLGGLSSDDLFHSWLAAI